MSESMPEEKKEIEVRTATVIGSHRDSFREGTKSEIGQIQSGAKSDFVQAQSHSLPDSSDQAVVSRRVDDPKRDKARQDLSEELARFVADKKDLGEDVTATPKNSAWDPDVDIDELLGLDDTAVEEHKTVEVETHVESETLRSIETFEEVLDSLEKQVETRTLTPQQEMEQIYQTMHNIKDKSFVAIRRAPERIGKWGKFKNRFMVGARWIAMAATSLFAGGIMYLKDRPGKKAKEEEKLPKAQEKRDHEHVPGREGVEFDKEDGTDQVYSDVRRGPLVWEKLTAGDPEDPPEVAILVEQSRRGSFAALDEDELGHTMIGLTYSRYNPSTRRKERYQIRMGFYPGGGMVGTTGTIAMSGGAILTGQLRNDAGHHYDIAKRYQVTPAQINIILREAEKYADGGYGYYQRNCTTFAVEMVKAAGIETGADLKPKEMRFKGKPSARQELGQALAPLSYWGGAALVADKLDKKDMTYHNFGQNMTTKADLARYYETATHENAIRKGYSPGALGEELRASDTGEMDAYYKEHRYVDQLSISLTINEVGQKLWEEVDKLIPTDKRIEEDETFRKLVAVKTRFDKDFDMTSTQLRELHKTVSLRMKAVSEYYRNRLGSDSRLSEAVLEYLSICEQYLTFINMTYAEHEAEDTQGDTSVLTSKFMSQRYSISYTDENGQSRSTEIEPAVYEGYLMAGATPAEIIRYMNDRARLQTKWSSEGLSPEEEKRLDECDRMYELALDFASANRYLLWKDNYTPEEIHYAFFDLKEKEKGSAKDSDVTGMLLSGYQPSRIYRAKMFEKIFDGLAEDKNAFSGAADLDYTEIDEYMCECLNDKTASAGFDKIIRCFVAEMKDEDGSTIVDEIMKVLSEDYLKVMYKKTDIHTMTQEMVIAYLNNVSGIRDKIATRVQSFSGKTD